MSDVSLWPPLAKGVPPSCAGCPRAARAPSFVPGYGALNARLIIIGEQPGTCEAGACDCPAAAHPRLRPFVGKSGRKIDVGLGGSRDGIFITNVRKCAPSGEESKEEKAASISHCVRTYLQAEMDAVASAHAQAGRTRAALQPVGADATRVVMGRGNMQKFHASVFSRAERDAMATAAEGVAPDADDDSEVPF